MTQRVGRNAAAGLGTYSSIEGDSSARFAKDQVDLLRTQIRSRKRTACCVSSWTIHPIDRMRLEQCPPEPFAFDSVRPSRALCLPASFGCRVVEVVTGPPRLTPLLRRRPRAKMVSITTGMARVTARAKMANRRVAFAGQRLLSKPPSPALSMSPLPSCTLEITRCSVGC